MLLRLVARRRDVYSSNKFREFAAEAAKEATLPPPSSWVEPAGQSSSSAGPPPMEIAQEVRDAEVKCQLYSSLAGPIIPGASNPHQLVEVVLDHLLIHLDDVDPVSFEDHAEEKLSEVIADAVASTQSDRLEALGMNAESHLKGKPDPELQAISLGLAVETIAVATADRNALVAAKQGP